MEMSEKLFVLLSLTNRFLNILNEQENTFYKNFSFFVMILKHTSLLKWAKICVKKLHCDKRTIRFLLRIYIKSGKTRKKQGVYQGKGLT